MKIENIDPHFKQEDLCSKDGKIGYTIPCEKFDLYGVFYDEALQKFVRMDHNVAQQVSARFNHLSTHTSGGRLRFSTDSSVIGISVTYSSLDQMSHMPLTGSCGFTLAEKVDNTYKTITVFRPGSKDEYGYSGEVRIANKGIHEYVLFFPLYNGVSSLKIYLDSSATLCEPEKYRDIAPILYYGASIDQGGCASRPDCSYPAMISKWNDIDFINLGFSGNCKGEPLVAEYLAGIDCSLFFMAYDGNAPSVEYLEQTHFPFYEIYRRAQKDVPIVFMSVPCFDNFPDAEKRREVLRNSYMKACENGDENVYFIDGETLFGEDDRDFCTVDCLHPNDLGFYRIAKVIHKLYQQLGL